MSDPSHGAADTAFPDPPEGSASVDQPLPSGEGGAGALAEGGRWRDYRIGKAVGACHFATDITSMEEVLIHTRLIGEGAAARREAWARLQQLSSEDVVAPREAEEESGRRYEVFLSPVGLPLPEWVAGRTVTEQDLEAVVRQLTARLEALHAAGVVHLQVEPRHIYVDSGEHGLQVRLGGLEAATLFDQPDLVPVTVNPFWAPPEAAGLYRHKPGNGLCAWDWWSLGRVMQSLVLGQHVYSQLWQRDVSAEPFELRARAEAVLLERDTSGVRAGAVELLPESVSPRLRLLLRGLLTTARDGRWRGEEVTRWLQSGTGPDRYALPRDARLFWWRRQAFTVPEAATFFLQPDYAFDGQMLFFPAPGSRTDSMRDFLADSPALHAEHERVGQILGYVDSLPWQQLPLNARRAAISGLAWRSLAQGGDARLAVQRWAVDAQGMQEMFADATPSEALALARVLSVTAYRRAVEVTDAAAGRTLALLAESGFEALNQGVARGWIAAGDEEAHARLLWFTFETDADLQARRDRLRTAYATARDPVLAALLSKERSTRTDLVLLAYLGESARRLGFVTHTEWAAEQAAVQKNNALRARAAIFWRRVERCLLLAPGLLGNWPIFGLIWLAPVAIVAIARGWSEALLLAAIACGLRGLAGWRLHRQAVEYGGSEWRLNHGLRRVRSEAARAMENLPAELRADLAKSFGEACQNLRQLLPSEAPLRAPPILWGMWVLATAAQLLPVVICVAPWIGVDIVSAPVAPEIIRRANAASVVRGEGTELYEVTNDGFGPRRRGPLRAWDVPDLEPRPMAVAGLEPASPVQRAFARVGGELLIEPYPREGLKITLAVPVEDSATTAVVLYDTETRELADDRTFQLQESPEAKRWYWLGNRRVVYLGVPPRLPAQNSLAQP